MDQWIGRILKKSVFEDRIGLVAGETRMTRCHFIIGYVSIKNYIFKRLWQKLIKYIMKVFEPS